MKRALASPAPHWKGGRPARVYVARRLRRATSAAVGIVGFALGGGLIVVSATVLAMTVN